MRIAWALAGVAFLVLMSTNGQYGYFRDELYYIAASDHLAAGYVDFAPLIAWITHVRRIAFGHSLHARPLLPALAFAAAVVLTGLIARELGGKRWGIAIACIATLVCPVMLGNA